jgi:hypothetical protein
MTIKVIQYFWGDQNRSYPMCREINKAYCRRHGYEYVAKTFPPRDDRAWRWSKIPAVREELHDCDFLLYLDADAFFYSHELTIEKEIIPLLKERLIVMSVDYISEGIRQQSKQPNTGVIFVRNTEKSAEIFRIWDESSERPGMEELRFHASGEQEACYQTVWQEYTENVTLLKDYYRMNGTRGFFIRHLMGMNDNNRLEQLKMFSETHQDIFPMDRTQRIS